MDPLPVQNVYNEVITGISPLERELGGVHPRLHFTARSIETLRGRLTTQPYAAMLPGVLGDADRAAVGTCPGPEAGGDLRGVGDTMALLAFAYVMTRQPRYLDAARNYLRITATWQAAKWQAGLLGGHLLYGMGVAFDWLYHDLDSATLSLVRHTLRTYGEYWFVEFATNAWWAADAYTGNHMAVHLGGLAAAAAAIYAEPPDAAAEVSRNGPWLKLVIERLRSMTAALGPDGLSPEGISYGEYYTQYLVRALDIAHGTLGVDFFAKSAWLKNYGMGQIYSSVPVKRWTPASCVLGFGDGVRSHWYGTDVMRRLASAARDAHVQGFADASTRDGTFRPTFLDMIWHDPTLRAIPLTDLPTFRHFNDMGVVVMRSGWDGDETVLALKCGPPHGHHALENYAHDIGGGHMHPDAGTFQLLVRGDRLIVDDGYTFKRTETQNTVLVNGIGQTGEGHEWFESVDLRRTKRGPCIRRAQGDEGVDDVVCDATGAYEPAAGLMKFLRHVIYVKPDAWIVVDELEAAEPAKFELAFHSDFAFGDDGPGRYIARGAETSLRVSALHPASVTTRTFRRDMVYTGGYVTHHAEALMVSNPVPVAAAVFVTVLEAFPAGATLTAPPQLAASGAELVVTIALGKGAPALRLQLRPGQSNRATPIFRAVV